ncbi:MAG: Glu-tRNA(Gln) amidotransferase subunit GatD [Candidatus Heimdallarchaeota archaeon]|nr:Glu-tRNA(Gln) amidotransferase subunit GatD [Candidatus Heimdallarchaeota archaeon]
MAKKKAKKTSTSLYGNYSKFIIDKFTAMNILPGDGIHIKMGDKSVEGNVISQNELGDPDVIIIKLDNGYNIGIAVDETVSIQKLDTQVDLENFQIRVPKQKKNLPRISLLGTGGTIASRIDYQTGGVVMAMEPEEIFASLPELFEEVSFSSVKSLFTMASEDIASEQWKVMASETYHALNDGSRGVVLLHGTDTMGYSSAALSFMLPEVPAPVVFTGAQRSSDRGSFDGAFNLISAARLAANADLSGVFVCMHESSNDDYCQLSRGTKVRKMHTTRRDAFKTINDTPISRIDYDGEIQMLQANFPNRGISLAEPLLGYEEKTALVKIHPNISPELIDFYIDKQYRGLIIEGTGLGHVPTFPPEGENRNLMTALTRALDEGIFVGMTSQCLNGRVHRYVYRSTRTGYKAGITYLEDMIPETALVKLGWALGNFEDEEIVSVMEKNLAGEISDRSYYQEYE